MAISNDFETQLRNPLWAEASGYLVEQWGLLQAQIAPLFGLVSSIQAVATSTAANALIGLSGYAVSAVLTTDSTGAPGFRTSLPAPLAFDSSTVITPSALTVNTNNYAPTSIQSAAVLRVSATGAVDLTGIVAATIPHAKLLVNVGAQTITLKHASASSSAANRLRCPGAADFSLTTFTATWIWYDVASTVWQVV